MQQKHQQNQTPSSKIAKKKLGLSRPNQGTKKVAFTL
jgi:hypothetical protein